MDSYYEQYVVSDDRGRNKKKKIFFTVLTVLSAVISVVFFIIFFLSLTGAELFPILFYGGMFGSGLAAFLFLRRARNRLDVDFDYIFKDGKFIIVKVFNRKARKKFIEVDVKSISAMGRVSLGNAERYISMPQVKKLYANISEDEDAVYYAFFSGGGDRNLLFFEPDAQTLTLFKSLIGNIIDREPVKKAAENR